MTRFTPHVLVTLSLLFLAGCDQPRAIALFDAGPMSDASTWSDAPILSDSGAGPDVLTADSGTAPMADAGLCVPDCAGRVCGSDGCGASCGSCSGAASCMSGVCRDSCPSNSSPSGDECACNRGYTVGPACDSCIPDPDLDQCPEHAHPQSGRCACDVGYVSEGCACAPDPSMMCPTGRAYYCGGCIDDADGNGCPANASPGADGCACESGFRFDGTGCACEAEPTSFTHPAFETDSCVGPLMTFDEASALYSTDRVLGAYQMVFRQRTCEDGRCTPWEQISLRDIPWATQASGVARLASISGEMNVDLQTGICRHYYTYSSTYIVGARCSGIGAELVCGSYHSPGICVSAYEPSEVYSLLGRSLRFYGQLRQDCLQLRADVTSGNVEAQAAILVTL